LRTTRANQLPKETGGVLLGVVDYERQRIHVAHCINGPSDSVSSSSEFERGISKLPNVIQAACNCVMHQVRYIGEWHSHPSGASARPSETDVSQITWLAKRLEPASQPGVMLIIAEDEMTVAIGDIATRIEGLTIPY
jgi:integrative and conjugative element protein (TIGR02256 family)